MKGLVEGFFMAWGNFSIIPCPYKVWTDRGKKWMLALMPFIGMIVGLINYFSYILITKATLNLPWFLLGAFFVILPIILTGFIHLDGFMDCCDAILSRRDLETRQRILKDSTVGAFAVVGLIIIFILNLSASFDLMLRGSFKEALQIMVFVHFVSRSLGSGDVLTLRPMGTSQYAYKNEEIRQKKAVILSWILLAGVFTLGVWCFYNTNLLNAYLVCILIVAATQKLASFGAFRNLDGINGDIAGYTIVLSELAGLISLSFLL